jgi:hypothetical protein
MKAQGRGNASFTSVAAALGKWAQNSEALKGRNNLRCIDQVGICYALSGLGIVLFRGPRAARLLVELANHLPWADM